MNLLNIYDSWRKRKNYEKAVELSKIGALWVHQNISSLKMEPLTKHFAHDERVTQNKALITTWKPGQNVTINFGDSLSDFTRPQLADSHDGIFSIGGSWANHMEQMAIDLHDDLKKVNVKNITIGCLGGNPMLVYYDYQTIYNSSIKCLNTVRKLYPTSRIIVYGIPPLYNIYATENCTNFDLSLKTWTLSDSNAKFLSLKEHFGTGFARFFPTSKWSADGVHFNESGGRKFGKLLKDLMV